MHVLTLCISLCLPVCLLSLCFWCNAPTRCTLVFGESVLNDAIAIVLFQAFQVRSCSLVLLVLPYRSIPRLLSVCAPYAERVYLLCFLIIHRTELPGSILGVHRGGRLSGAGEILSGVNRIDFSRYYDRFIHQVSSVSRLMVWL